MCLVVNHVYGSEAFFFINGKNCSMGTTILKMGIKAALPVRSLRVKGTS